MSFGNRGQTIRSMASGRLRIVRETVNREMGKHHGALSDGCLQGV